MLHFHLFRPLQGGTFEEQLDAVSEQFLHYAAERNFAPDQLVAVRLYLTDAANQYEPFTRHLLYQNVLSQTGFSYIEQPILDGGKLALYAAFCEVPVVSHTAGEGTASYELATGQTLHFHSVRFGGEEAGKMDAEEQTREAFDRHVAFLRERGLTLRDHCLRTWIYVRDIDRHYAAMVKARNEIFAREGLGAGAHTIASTGIGGATAVKDALVSIDFFSMSKTDGADVAYLQAPGFMNPATDYGVAFERATALTVAGTRYALVSGTASIDERGKCLFPGDVQTQAGRLFLNIEKLLENGGMTLKDLRCLVVYLRDVSDALPVSRYLHLRFRGLPCVVTEARVCRPEWLIEVEGIAVKPSEADDEA